MRSRSMGETPLASVSGSEKEHDLRAAWCPASTLERSRMWLISDQQVPPRGEHLFDVLVLLLVQLSKHPLLEDLSRTR